MLTSGFKRLLIPLGLVALAMMLLPEEADARGRSSSSSRGSFSRSSSSSRSTPSRTNTSFSSRGTGTTKRVTAVRKPTNATETDKAAFQANSQSNSFNKSDKTYANQNVAKDAAAQDFNQRYGKQYPTKFEKEPSKRPEYIPETYVVDGSSRRVEYRMHNGVGGYYYAGPSDSYILYDVSRDPYTRNRYMYQHGYDPSGRMYTRSGWSFVTVMMWVGGIFLVVIVMYFVFSRLRSS